jgi:predicted acyltransferase (DUF342 family)
MKPQPAFSQTSGPSSQRGIATVLIVVLIGVALTATAMTIMHSMRSTQEKQVAVHAATNAQNGVWAAVEAFRLFLEAQGVGDLVNGQSYDITLEGYGSMIAKDVYVEPIGTGHRVTANVVHTEEAARASAAVGVIYEITPGTPHNYHLSAPLNFNDDLKLTSNMTFDTPMEINVKGNVEITNAHITNLRGLNATGSVTVTSNGAVDLGVIHANGDVTLGGTSPAATEVKSQGNVTLRDTASVPRISANGDVLHNASSNTTSLRSRANVTIGSNSGNHSLIVAGGGVTINSPYSGTITELWSVNTITNNSTGAHITNIFGQGNLDCPGAWNKFTNISINGTFTPGCTSPLSPAAGQTVNRPAGVTVNVMNPVPSFNMPTLAVDVYPYREEANYILSYEDGKIKIVVKNIHGVADGIYYLGNGRGICASVDASGNCVGAITKYMCLGYSENESCMTYSPKSFTVAENTDGTITYQDLPGGAHPSKGTFTIAGGGIAPGIWWIDGNLVLSNGYNNGTLLVTGNIATSNHYRGAAVNYGGEPIVYTDTIRNPAQRTTPYQEVCQAIATGMQAEMSHLVNTYKTRFQNQYPTNLCDKTPGVETYTPHLLGNIALAAGGIRPESLEGDGTTFSGGDISIKSNSNVFGIVLAGGYLVVRNNVAIMGYVSASVQGAHRGASSVKNLSDGDVKIYTDSATEWYSPNEVPWMGENPCLVGCGSGGTGATAKLLWSKYL